MEIGWITEKPNRYPIFLKTDTEYRTDIYKNRPKKRKPTPTENTDTDPPLQLTRPLHANLLLQHETRGHSYY